MRYGRRGAAPPRAHLQDAEENVAAGGPRRLHQVARGCRRGPQRTRRGCEGHRVLLHLRHARRFHRVSAQRRVRKDHA